MKLAIIIVCLGVTLFSSSSFSAPTVNKKSIPLLSNDYQVSASGTRVKLVRVGVHSQFNEAINLVWQSDPSQLGTLGAYLNFSPALNLVSTPKALAVSVHIPMELANKKLWLRASLLDSNNKHISISYNTESDSLPKTGWHQFIATIPAGFTAPYKLAQPLRALILANNKPVDGSIALASVTPIYDLNADHHGPKINLCPQQPSLTHCLTVTDRSGVNHTQTQLFIDDLAITHEVNKQGKITFSNGSLLAGWHKVTAHVIDNLGNSRQQSEYFYHHSQAPEVKITNLQKIYPTRTETIAISLNRAPAELDITITINASSTAVNYELVSANHDLKITRLNNESWRLEGENKVANIAELALIKLTIDEHYPTSQLHLNIHGRLNKKAFSLPIHTVKVQDYYLVREPWLYKNQAQTLTVLTQSNTPAENVKVRLSCNKENRLTGETTDQGVLFIPKGALTLCDKYVRVALSSKHSNAIKQRLLLSPMASFETLAYKTVSSTNSHVLNTITSSKSGLLSNEQELAFTQGAAHGLVTVKRKLAEHNVQDSLEEVRIHLLGDTQTAANMNKHDGAPLVGQILAQQMRVLSAPDLVFHVGDFSDDINRFELVRQFLEQYSQSAQKHVPLVMAHGNHELSYDNSDKFKHLFSYHPKAKFQTLADKQIFSFDYKQLHVAVLNSELQSHTQWQSMTDWLSNDMSNSNKPWKIVLLHRPAYAANPASGNHWVHRYLPKVVDKLGINVVISGHDHIYTRSKPIKNGKLNKNGATYLIAGSASQKFYDAGSAGIVPFADVLFDHNQHVYTTLQFKGPQLYLKTLTTSGKVVDEAVLHCCN